MSTIFDDVSAAGVTPYFARIAPYVPLAISVLIAAWIATASCLPDVVFGVAIPYGATSIALPTSLKTPWRLGDHVTRDLAVEEPERRVARRDREVRLGLGRVRQDVNVLDDEQVFAVFCASSAPSFRFRPRRRSRRGS